MTGLYLLVRDPEHKFWLLRYTIDGRTREAGLGPAAGPDTVSLATVRDKAREMRTAVRAGRDPLEEKATAKALKAAEAIAAKIAAVTFATVAERYLKAHETGWKNPKHRQQWSNTLRDYVLPIIGAVPVAEVAGGHIELILDPIWHDKPETARRVRGRVGTILDFAKARGLRTGDNPVEILKRSQPHVGRVEHHAALPWREIGAFMPRLHKANGMGAMALQFLILTAARSGEVRGATWREIDLERGVWTVPRDRMKAGVEHRVPLSGPAMALLHKLAQLRTTDDAFVIPGGRAGSPLSDVSVSKAMRAAGGDGMTVHGFRSSFRDWVAEATAYPRELAEKALAHTNGDKVEAAYQRSDFFEKRARLMEEWATFCSRPMQTDAAVIQLRPEARLGATQPFACQARA